MRIIWFVLAGLLLFGGGSWLASALVSLWQGGRLFSALVAAPSLLCIAVGLIMWRYAARSQVGS